MPEALLDHLNDQQREAVTAPDGALLVLAGAGSGKTRVIVHRIAYLIDARGKAPETILAVTFTNKAADEMRARVRALLSDSEKDVAVHTFHALALRLLRRFGEDVGLRSGFTLYATDDRKALLRRICREKNVSEREYPLTRIASAVSEYKLRAFSGRRSGDPRFQQVLEMVAPQYQKELDARGAVDFDDLLLRGVELMECSERAQGFAERRFRHLLVDEYQDTDRIQFRLLRLLAPHGNVFVVGDEDQSIYNFRGADLRNILDFESDFPNARTVKLEVNYRSGAAILRAASAVIQNNRSRKGKRLIASLDEGVRPQLHGAEDDRGEAVFVARTLDRRRRDEPNARAAILLRTHAQTRVFEEELVARGVPHRVLGGLRFYDRREIKDVLAYVRLVSNPHDDASFVRVVNVPQRGVGQATMAMLQRTGSAAGCSLWDAAREVLDGDLLPGRPRLGLTQFRDVVLTLTEKAAHRRPSELIRMALGTAGLLAELEREGEGEGEAVARERKENLDQLIAATAEYESREAAPTLHGFLDGVGLLTDIDAVEGPAPCLLMTLHAAKGLEFDVVFLAGLEEGLFPHIRASGDPKALEEERRLFYVGMTRAKKRLYLSFAESRRFSYQTSSRQPSRFLAEIPDRDLDGAQLSRGVPESGPSSPKSSRGSLRPGVLVRHDKFGEGRIVDATGSGPDRKVTVVFRKAGRKRLVAQYAKLQVLN